MRIEEEIKQRSFANDFHKAHVNIIYTSAWLGQGVSQALKPFNISPQQFNILRILRGAYPKPCSIRELTERMLDKSSNASRLVEKLIAKNLVVKTISEIDNRKANVAITENGLNFLRAASDAVENKIQATFQNLTFEEAAALSAILDKLRD